MMGQPLNPRRSPEEFRSLAQGQFPEAVIVSCADSRVAPEILFDVGVGDIVILPPGTVHQWTSIPQEMRYIILRIDPEHRQKAGFVQTLLKR